MKKAEYDGQVGYYDETQDKFYPETSLQKAEYEGKKGFYHAESDSFHSYDFGESKTLQSKKPDVNTIPEKYTAEYALKSAAQVGASLIEPIAGTYGWVKKAAQQYILPSIYGKADVVEMRNSMHQAQADYEKLQKSILGETTPTAESFMNDIFAPITQQIRSLRETFGIPQSDAEIKKGSMDEKWQAAADLIENIFMILGMTKGAIHSAKPMMSRFEKLKVNVAQEALQRGEHKKAADIYNQMMKDNPELASKVTKDVTDKAKEYMQDAKKNLSEQIDESLNIPKEKDIGEEKKIITEQKKKLTQQIKTYEKIDKKTKTSLKETDPDYYSWMLKETSKLDKPKTDPYPRQKELEETFKNAEKEYPDMDAHIKTFMEDLQKKPVEEHKNIIDEKVKEEQKNSSEAQQKLNDLDKKFAEIKDIGEKSGYYKKKYELQQKIKSGKDNASFLAEEQSRIEQVLVGKEHASFMEKEISGVEKDKINEVVKTETPVKEKTSIAEVIKNEEKPIETSSAKKEMPALKESGQPVEETKTVEVIKSSEETKIVDESSIIEQGRKILKQDAIEQIRKDEGLKSKKPLSEKDIEWLKENKDVLEKNTDIFDKKDIDRINELSGKEDVREAIPQEETFTEEITSAGEIKKLTPEEEKLKAFIDVEHNDASEEAKQALFEKMTSDKSKKGRESILKRIDADETLYTKIKNRMKESKNTYVTDEMKATSDAYFKDTSKLRTGLDSEGIKHLGIIAGYYIEKGARNFDAFAKVMVEQYGEVVKPYLQKAWDEALPKLAKRQGSLEPSQFAKILNIISSPNRILERAHEPLARKLAKRVVDAQTFKDMDRVAEYKKLDKILKPIKHDEKLHEQVFNLLNKFTTVEDIQKAEGYSPKAIQAASGMREWFQDMLHKLQEANVTDKEGNKITDFGAYVTHIKESPAFPKEIKQIVNELFSGETTSDIYGTGVEDVMGWRRKKQTPLFSSAEKRMGDVEHLEKDMHRIARSYVESAMVVLHDKPAILEGREIIKDMKEGYTKNIATDYLSNFAHTMMETDTTFKKLDNIFARIGARNVIPFNTKVQMLHLGRLMVQGMPEVGIFTTINSMGRVMLNPKEAYRKVHNGGILQADVVPWAFKRAGEQFAQIGNFYDAGNTAAKVVLYDALERKINKMHPELSAEERQLKTIQETIRIEGVVTGANRNLLLAKTPKSFAQYKNWVQKTLENYRYAVEDVFTPGISKKQRMQNALKVARYAAMGYAAIKITEETGIQLFHLSGKSLKLGSTTLTYMGKIVEGLGKGDLEKVALDTIKFFTPAYNSLSREWEKGGTAIDKSQKHSALVIPEIYIQMNPETLKRTLGVAGIGVVGMIVGEGSALAHTLPKEGWFKGEEGKMKYELTDTSSMGITSSLNDIITSQIMDSKASVTSPYKKTSKLSNIWNPTYLDTGGTTLFDHYPALKDVKTEINYVARKHSLEKKTSSGVLTNFIDKDGNRQHKFYATGNSISAINETLLHEIQHWIQEKELFAKGGNPEDFKHFITNQMVDESEVVKKAIKKHNDIYAKYKKEMDDYYSIPLEESKTTSANLKYQNLLKQEQILKTSLLQIDKIRNKEYTNIKKRLNSWINVQAQLRYQALAGEIEARDTASRIRMTPEQRKNDPVYSSTNIPKERWIIKQ